MTFADDVDPPPRAPGLRNPDPTKATPVRWAWKGRVPIGRLSLIVGNEGIGKGTVVAYLAAQWSRGSLEGDMDGTPGGVLVVGDEDALHDVWTPRLYAAGADWPRVWFPDEDVAELDLTAPRDIERLRGWVRDYGVRVVIFDALLDHLGGASVDEFKAKSVRNALRPIRRLAADEGFAALGSMHPRKGRALTFRDLIANSHQFNAVSRSSLLLAEHPDDKAKRVLARAKGNLAGHVPTLEFRIGSHVFDLNGHTFDEPHAVGWEESALTTADIMTNGGNSPGRPRDEDKREAVIDTLSDQPQSAVAISKAAAVPRSTVRDILAELAEDCDIVRTDAGWVLAPDTEGGGGNLETLSFRHPPAPSENGVGKPNQVGGNCGPPSSPEGVLGVFATPQE